MRARPEPLECLSDAPFLGKLLVFPANVRLDWKVIARYKNYSLFGLIVTNEEKRFYNTDTWILRLASHVDDAAGTETWKEKLQTF